MEVDAHYKVRSADDGHALAPRRVRAGMSANQVDADDTMESEGVQKIRERRWRCAEAERDGILREGHFLHEGLRPEGAASVPEIPDGLAGGVVCRRRAKVVGKLGPVSKINSPSCPPILALRVGMP